MSKQAECCVCDQFFPESEMTRCDECKELVCQPCGQKSVYLGCANLAESKTCHDCFTTKHEAKPLYCTLKKCDCGNRDPDEALAKQLANAMKGYEGLHNESDTSESDTDFVLRKCGDCGERAIGKSMYDCEECQLPICQSCDTVYMGCARDQEPVCMKCFKGKFKGRRKYCDDEDCNCSNSSPKKQNKIAASRAVEERKNATFRATFNVAKWKQQHKAIDYPSRHKGKYLIDLFLSTDSFESGYLKWLVETTGGRPPNYSEADYQNFRSFQREAAEILALYAKCQPQQTTYNLRKRDASPKGKKKK